MFYESLIFLNTFSKSEEETNAGFRILIGSFTDIDEYRYHCCTCMILKLQNPEHNFRNI